LERAFVLDYDRVAAMQAATHLWVEVRYVVQNLGAGVPGNQIDLTKGTRVFFGLEPRRVAPNTALGSVIIRYGPHTTPRHMRFGDNSMDKLDLPIPGVEGPPTYENSNLLFTKRDDTTFELSAGTTRMRNAWRRRSAAAGTSFRMNSGREWGVF
jgi:hypothetical protein